MGYGKINIIKNVEKMRRIISKLLAIIKKRKFTTSGDYWENRYKKGGNSGAGSYNRLAEFKAEIINNFALEHNISSVIEFGCGDGNNLKLFTFASYIGYDVSNTVLDICKNIYEGDKTKKFIHASNYQGETAEISLSLDVIYHLIEDDVFEQYMNLLFSSSHKFVIIYSSNTESLSPASHIRHRKFSDWIEKERSDFFLLEFVPNKYPFVEGDSNTSFAEFYIYEKKKVC
ncbi:MAG: class I SAM-dependent methyltransferase [Bacteroidales bacterium]|jgi:SAM-dependent methyltransferase|nr:class I SAM-dependent methyltransferase [Bacteroidales bacterium]